jgi:hypothetical protein
MWRPRDLLVEIFWLRIYLMFMSESPFAADVPQWPRRCMMSIGFKSPAKITRVMLFGVTTALHHHAHYLVEG